MSLLYTNVMGANCPGTKVFHCGTPLPTLPSLVLLLLLLQYTLILDTIIIVGVLFQS